MKIALVETKPSRTDFEQHFELKLDRYCLCSDPSVKKILKKDIDIEINTDEYDWIILVGADSFKYFTKNGSITDYSGKVVNEKFIPIINPAMLDFKPEAKPLWESSRESLLKYIRGDLKAVNYSEDSGLYWGITDEADALKYLQEAIDHPNKFVALDSETTGFYPRDGYVLGISLCYRKDYGAYISSECITEAVEQKAQELWYKKKVIFQNAKFDRAMLKYHFGWKFPSYEDTMLLHYLLDENPGGHGLKELALKYTKYGDYEKPLYEFIENYRKTHGVLKDQFTFDLIPFNIIVPYAAIDSIVTFLIYIKLKPAVEKNKQLLNVYDKLLIPGSTFLEDVQDNGVPFDLERLKKAQKMMDTDIQKSIEELYKNPKIKEFEEFQGKEFNPNSTQQLRKLLFDFLGLKPVESKRTTTGAYSTDAEVLELLSEQSPVPSLILNIRKKSKIKNTYLDKIIPQLDKDYRLRTSFNLHSTTSGRLSSSGKLNMQQLPRDNPLVKGCIRAKPGYKIVSGDLSTAEVNVAAVLSGDKNLMGVFIAKGDFHSTIAKLVFNLDCAVEDVKELYPLLRQAAKAIDLVAYKSL